MLYLNDIIYMNMIIEIRSPTQFKIVPAIFFPLLYFDRPTIESGRPINEGINENNVYPMQNQKSKNELERPKEL